VDGETIARKILRDAEFADVRPRLAFEFGRILARIHAVPLSQLPPLSTSPAHAAMAAWDLTQIGDETPRPVFELARRWLIDHVPKDAPVERLVHGDFRVGNMIVARDGVRAVLDWEIVHTGDPMEDLAWICLMPWRFGIATAPVGGLGQREDLYAGYTSEGGDCLDRERIRWWELFGSLKWGEACANPLSGLRKGHDRPIERAMIGRRASESEIDLLRLLWLED
jgi:aminoglycoside phosphotransferase (APT) family kinase protein